MWVSQVYGAGCRAGGPRRRPVGPIDKRKVSAKRDNNVRRYLYIMHTAVQHNIIALRAGVMSPSHQEAPSGTGNQVRRLRAAGRREDGTIFIYLIGDQEKDEQFLGSEKGVCLSVSLRKGHQSRGVGPYDRIRTKRTLG